MPHGGRGASLEGLLCNAINPAFVKAVLHLRHKILYKHVCVRNHTSRPVFATACWGRVSFHPGVKGCAGLEQGHSQLSRAVEEGTLAVVFALGPAPRGCADPVPLNKAKFMSYTCVAIVFAAVFVVNTLAAAIMSGVFSVGAKKTALTEQPQDSRACQVEKPSDAGKQSEHLSPLQGCDLCWL